MRVGENPLNGSGTHPIKDEDIVYSQAKVCGAKSPTGCCDPIKLFPFKIKTE